MSNNVKNDHHKETMGDIYNSMSVEQRGLFDAAIATAWQCGEEVGQMTQNTAMLAAKMTDTQAELLIKMSEKAYSKGEEVGKLKAQGLTPEEISKKLHIKLNKNKKEEPDNGSSENG